MISSGASLEYQIIDPAPATPSLIKGLRSANTYCPFACTNNAQQVPLLQEKDREQQAQQSFEFLRAPTSLSPVLKLSALSDRELLLHNYVYTSLTTKGSASNASKDYVVLAQWRNDAQLVIIFCLIVLVKALKVVCRANELLSV